MKSEGATDSALVCMGAKAGVSGGVFCEGALKLRAAWPVCVRRAALGESRLTTLNSWCAVPSSACGSCTAYSVTPEARGGQQHLCLWEFAGGPESGGQGAPVCALAPVKCQPCKTL